MSIYMFIGEGLSKPHTSELNSGFFICVQTWLLTEHRRWLIVEQLTVTHDKPGSVFRVKLVKP